MWFFQRSDTTLRNEWSNYTNWPYQDILPYNVYIPNPSTNKPYLSVDCSGGFYPSEDLDKNPTGILDWRL